MFRAIRPSDGFPGCDGAVGRLAGRPGVFPSSLGGRASANAVVPRAGARPARQRRPRRVRGAAERSLGLGVAERRGIPRGSYRGSRGRSHARRRRLLAKMIRGTRRHRQREIGRAGAKRSRPLGSTGGGGIHQVPCRGARARSGLTSEGAPRARSRAQKPPEMGGASHARRISPASSRFGGRAVSLAATLGHRWALVAFDSENSAIKFHALAAPQRGRRAKRARPPTGSSQPR